MKTPSVPRSFHIDKRAGEILAAGHHGNDDQLMTTEQTAAWLGVSTQWLEIRRCNGGGPPFERISARTVRYRRDKVRHWLDQRSYASTKAYSPSVKRGAR
jgi:hypothetical protein